MSVTQNLFCMTHEAPFLATDLNLLNSFLCLFVTSLLQGHQLP